MSFFPLILLRHRHLKAAALFGAIELGALAEEGGAALFALGGHRHIPGHEVAVGVALTAVVDAALSALALQHTALAALGADAAGVLHEALGAAALGEAAAGQELAVLAHLDDHGTAAEVADLAGRLVRHLDLLAFHVLLGLLEAGGEALVEVVHGLVPVRLAALDLIEVFFHLCREVHVHDVGELLQHQAIYGPAQQGRLQLFLVALHIAAVDDGGDDGRIGGGAADAVFFQRLDEGGFGVAGGRLGELLLALQLPQLEHLTLLEGRKAGLLLFLLVGGLFVQGGEAVEGDRVAAGLEAVAAGIDGDGHGVLLAVRHLAGHEAAPDHPVELGGIAADALVHLVTICVANFDAMSAANTHGTSAA